MHAVYAYAAYAISILLVIQIVIFFLLVRSGYNKVLLILSAVLGVLSFIGLLFSHVKLLYAMIDGVMGFLGWYILLDVVYRVAVRGRKL